MTDAAFLAWLKTNAAIRTVIVEVYARISGVETLLRLSSRPYITGAADTPAHTEYDTCVVGGVSFSESLNLDGQPSISYGAIELENRGGVRDAWLNYVWANRAIQVYVGDPSWPKSDFRKVFDGVVGDITGKGPENLSLSLLDKLQRLNNPMTETLLGGTTVNKDRLLPTTAGEVANVTPLQTDASLLEYQVHSGVIEDIIEVRDNGAPVSVTKYTSLGKFRLTSAPVGQITCDVQGLKPSGTYSNNVCTLIKHIVQNYGPASTRFTAGDLDSTNLNAFEAANTQAVGMYLPDRQNVLAACQELAASVGAQVLCSTQGLLRLIKISLPTGVATTVVQKTDYVYHSLEIAQRPDVKSTNMLGYCKNYTPQTSGLATGLPASSQATLAKEYFTVTNSDSSVASVYKLDAAPPQENTLLVNETEANTESARRLALWKVARTVYKFVGFSQLMLVELGDALQLYSDRFGLSSGPTGLVVGVDRDWIKNRVTISVLM